MSCKSKVAIRRVRITILKETLIKTDCSVYACLICFIFNMNIRIFCCPLLESLAPKLPRDFSIIKCTFVPQTVTIQAKEMSLVVPPQDEDRTELLGSLTTEQQQRTSARVIKKLRLEPQPQKKSDAEGMFTGLCTCACRLIARRVIMVAICNGERKHRTAVPLP